MGVKVTVTLDRSRVKARIKAGVDNMIPAVTEQALADCNYFAPQDQNILRASAAINTSLAAKYQPKKDLTPERQKILDSAQGSDIKNGVIVYDTPYARRRYYTGTPSQDENPNASIKWCEKAHDTFGAEWDKTAQKSFTEGMGT